MCPLLGRSGLALAGRNDRIGLLYDHDHGSRDKAFDDVTDEEREGTDEGGPNRDLGNERAPGNTDRIEHDNSPTTDARKALR